MRARTRWVGVAAAAICSTTLVVVTEQPASAAITATSSGNIVNVSVTGPAVINFACTGGNITVFGSLTAPPLACTAVTRVNVLGDGDSQLVQGDTLNNAAFVSNPYLVALTGGGNDSVYGSLRADSMTTGGGNDFVGLTTTGVADTSIDLGADTDQLAVDGGTGNDTISATSTGATVTMSLNEGGGAIVQQASGAETFALRGNAGNDSISVAGVTAASTLSPIYLISGAGNDQLIGGGKPSVMYGQSGTNTMIGGSADEDFSSESETDIIQPGGGTNDVSDQSSLRLGRSIANQGTNNGWFAGLGFGRDAVVRIRPQAGNATLVTTSLDRPGQQNLGSSFSAIELDLGNPGTIKARHLLDVVVPSTGRVVEIEGDEHDDDLADITVPTGSWSTSGTAATTLEITPSSGTLGHITLHSVSGAVSIHGPWTDRNQGFVHRAFRDLLYRFPSAAVRDPLAGDLGGGDTTRSAIVSDLMDTDEYRGLDVDRVFVKYLRRTADSGGRTYWINSIRNGKALWRFRAQLFGGNEYFAKAGGTNGNYVFQAYRDVLGRNPDPSGPTYWTNKLNNGADRGSVALQFINSPEARRRLVDDQFLRFLDRLPTAHRAEHLGGTDSLRHRRAGTDRVPDDEQHLLQPLLSASGASTSRSPDDSGRMVADDESAG